MYTHGDTEWNEASNESLQTSAQLPSLTPLQGILSVAATLMKATIHLTLIDQAAPVGTFTRTKGTIALFKFLERLNQLVMYQGPVVSGIKQTWTGILVLLTQTNEVVSDHAAGMMNR